MREAFKPPTASWPLLQGVANPRLHCFLPERLTPSPIPWGIAPFPSPGGCQIPLVPLPGQGSICTYWCILCDPFVLHLLFQESNHFCVLLCPGSGTSLPHGVAPHIYCIFPPHCAAKPLLLFTMCSLCPPSPCQSLVPGSTLPLPHYLLLSLTLYLGVACPPFSHFHPATLASPFLTSKFPFNLGKMLSIFIQLLNGLKKYPLGTTHFRFAYLYAFCKIWLLQKFIVSELSNLLANIMHLWISSNLVLLDLDQTLLKMW